MSNHAALSAALLAAFNLDADGAKPEDIAKAAATVLIAFADAVRGPALTDQSDEPPPGSRPGYWLHPIGTLHPTWIECNPPATGSAASGLPG